MVKYPLSLPIVDSSHGQQDILFSSETQKTADVLWLAIYFPKLAIEIVSSVSSNSILVAVEQVQGKAQVHTASTLAEGMGIFRGMPINAAYSLCPNIELVTYEPDRLYQQLEQIAVWAEQFTSKISIYQTSTLVLEVLASVKLFGGLTNLLRVIRERLHRRYSYRSNFAVSPTVAASILLASIESSVSQQNDADVVIVHRIEELRSKLGNIRLSRLPLTRKTNKQLHRLGIKFVRDLLRLPKADIARRYGRDISHYLDKLLGVLPEVPSFQHRPEVFQATWSLAFETKNGQIISSIVARLLQQLQDFLQQRDACLRAYDIYFEHVKKKPTVLTVRFRQASRDNKHFILLFEQRFQQCRVDTAVIGIRLFANKLETYTATNESLIFSPDLFSGLLTDSNPNDATINQLLELLQVRLGEEAINSLQVCADHRPDRAYRFMHQLTHSHKHAVNHSELKVAPQERPLWLLISPQVLTYRNKTLYYQSVLSILSGPERIESAWWAEGLCRDYYVASTKQGQTLWIFQELTKPYQWYVHGFFA